MRVLAMVHGYPPTHNAGAEVTLHTELRHLAARGHEVHVLLSRPSKRHAVYTLDGVTVHPRRSQGDPYGFFGTQDLHPDVVISHLENTARASCLAGDFDVSSVHLVHNNHAFTKDYYLRLPVHLAVFNTDWIADEYVEHWQSRWGRKKPPPRHIVIHPPVVADDYQVKHGDRITLINLNEEKGGELFWELADELPDRKFLGVRGSYGNQVIADHPDTFPNVELLPVQRPDQMAEKVYARTKLLLMPSSYESYGRTAIEAAHCGIPTIAHPTPGLIEALGEAGTFVDRDDLDGW
jgi:glycosyltransferase involved in cell wall biosynthesis